MYEHLNLKAWPFQVVPDSEFAAVWAGRPETKSQLDRLVRKMQLVPKSSLHLLWSNFGMGKTHTLLHLQHLCRRASGGLIPVYSSMPNRPRGFLDVYRAIVSQLPYEELGEQLLRLGSTWSGSLTQHAIFASSPGIVSALLAIRGGDAETAMAARQWLIAQPGLTARDRRTFGATYSIKTPEDGVSALGALTNLATYGSGGARKLIVLLDEYQRIGELTPRVRHEINAGMHTYFNCHPRGVEIILSFSFGRQDNVGFLVSEELKSRAEPQSISLDVLSRAQAVEFMRDLLQEFHLRDDGRWAYPFAPQAVVTLVEQIAQSKALTPRRIMLYANHVLLESQLGRDPSDTSEITEEEVENLLRDLGLGALDVDPPDVTQ